MASHDDDSLCSVELAIPGAGGSLGPTPPPSKNTPTKSRNKMAHLPTPSRLQVPTFQISVEDVDASDDELLGSASNVGSNLGASGIESGSNLGGGSHESGLGSSIHENRPHSVLSILRGPLSAISRPFSNLSSRAKSALSNRSTNLFTLPANVRVRALLHRFARRARGSRRKDDDNDSTDSLSTISDPEGSVHSRSIKKKLDSLAGSEYGDDDDGGKKRWRDRCPKLTTQRRPTCNYFIDPHGDVFLFWMGLLTLAYIYNAVAIPLRASFGDVVQPLPGLYAWLVFDYLFDLLFVLDIVLVQAHLSYRHNGVLESNVKLLSCKYFMHWWSWLDLLALLPLDILYAVPLLRWNTLLRLPRLLKFQSVKVFLDRFESQTKFPHAFRVAKLVSYFLYIVHIYTCIFYAVSKSEGFGVNDWVYDGSGTSYVHCFYWATLTVTAIHDLEERNPTTTIEYTVEMLGYLLGIFIIAIFIGEIRNIVEAANTQKLVVYRNWDRLKEYMQLWKTPKEVQERVQSWYEYTLSQQLMLDESQVLDSLPKKMKSDLAIHVHLDTLCKVGLFQDYEKTLLRELVLKLRPVLYIPGDYICKKGEIGKEMYIVNQGQVQVVGGAECNEVLAELGPGSVFGEISLLAVGGGNRRTAHVRSKGFSSLFVLSKKDLHETLVDYPDAQEILKKKARYLLRQDKKREYRRSQQAQHLTSPADKLTRNVGNTQVAKAAVTALTTAARAARARAAANKLQEEEGSARPGKDKGAQVVVHLATVHERSGEEGSGSLNTAVTSSTSTVLAKVAAAARMRQFTSQQPASQLTISSLAASSPSARTLGEANSASTLTYSSLWPAPKEVVSQIEDPSLFPSVTLEQDFHFSEDSSTS